MVGGVPRGRFFFFLGGWNPPDLYGIYILEKTRLNKLVLLKNLFEFYLFEQNWFKLSHILLNIFY